MPSLQPSKKIYGCHQIILNTITICSVLTIIFVKKLFHDNHGSFIIIITQLFHDNHGSFIIIITQSCHDNHGSFVIIITQSCHDYHGSFVITMATPFQVHRKAGKCYICGKGFIKQNLNYNNFLLLLNPEVSSSPLDV